MAKTLIKRRHTELHPERYATENGKLRNMILPHIYKSENNRINVNDHDNYCGQLQTELGLSYNPKNWYKKFPKYVRRIKKPDGYYLILTRLGRNLVTIVLDD